MDMDTEIARGNPDAIACWERSCRAAPCLSEKNPPYFIGDLCWPDGNDKQDLSQMLYYNGLQWLALQDAMKQVYKVQE